MRPKFMLVMNLWINSPGAGAKKLNRHWIGFEQDEKYVRVAQNRIDAIQAAAYDEALFASSSGRKPARILFNRLLEIGLISPGQRLYLCKGGKFEDKVRLDASIICGELVGSIHKLAKALLKAPANGWEQWYYVDKGGQKQPIDNLRKLYRKIEKYSI